MMPEQKDGTTTRHNQFIRILGNSEFSKKQNEIGNSVVRKFRTTADNDKIFKINFYNCENPIEFYGIKIMQGLEIEKEMILHTYKRLHAVEPVEIER